MAPKITPKEPEKPTPMKFGAKEPLKIPAKFSEPVVPKLTSKSEIINKPDSQPDEKSKSFSFGTKVPEKTTINKFGSNTGSFKVAPAAPPVPSRSGSFAVGPKVPPKETEAPPPLPTRGPNSFKSSPREIDIPKEEKPIVNKPPGVPGIGRGPNSFKSPPRQIGSPASSSSFLTSPQKERPPPPAAKLPPPPPKSIPDPPKSNFEPAPEVPKRLPGT
jgi:hypothetical protein